MQKLLETFAFTMLIAGQFLAAIVTLSKRAILYPDSRKQRQLQDQPQSPERTDPEEPAESAETAQRSRAEKLLSDALSARR
jgi:hypothetical protein